MSSDATTTLISRNLAALRRTGNAHIADAVAALPPPTDDSVTLPIYGADPAAYLARQLEEYDRAPTRYALHVSGAPEHSPQISHKAMRAVMSNLQGKFLETVPDPDGGFMISFGLGLGGHLPHLIEQYDFERLVILEPNLDFIHRCLLTLDWEAIEAQLAARNRSLDILHAQDPVVLARAALVPLRSSSYLQLDGSFVFTHYRNEVMDRVIEEVRGIIPVLEGNDGFFEDELRMLDQCVSNCLTHDHHLLYDKPGRSLKEIPVVVAGAGPSLDDTIEDIRRNRENVILVSCSTSLRPLLSAGLVPDFHAEVENMPDNVTIVEDAASLHDISDIVLLGTNTVMPGVVAPFKRRILYWRESVVSSRLFSDQDRYINLAGPSVANLAVRACVSMGFYEFYLFGVDMGSRDPSQHHAKSSIYYDRTDEYWNSGAQMAPFTLPQPGNMRDTVYTNASFLLCKLYLDRLFQTFSNHFFFNCSDGVRLEGAPPVLPATLNALPAKMPRREIVDACLSELDFHRAGEQISRARAEQFADGLDAWFNAALGLAGNSGPATTRALNRAFYPLLGSAATNAGFSVDSAVKGLCTGTLTSILQFGHFFERRLPPEERAPFMQVFRAALSEALLEMQDRGMALAGGLATRIEREI